MLLAVDIGNSFIKFGIFDGSTLLSKFAIPTKRDLTADDIKLAAGANIDLPISWAVVCSVVPAINAAVGQYLKATFTVNPFFVTNDLDFELTIKYEPLEAAGTDRLVNSFGAVQKYGVPCVILSFGTATTIDVINENRELLGGLIAPGMTTMAKALLSNTAKLPEVTVEKPKHLIGCTTETSIRSGIFYGQIGLVESVVSRIKDEIGGSPKTIATGGFAYLIAQSTDLIDVVDENLTLDGLRMLHSRLRS